MAAIHLHGGKLLLPGQRCRFLNKFINSIGACWEHNGARGVRGSGGVFMDLTGNLAANSCFGEGCF